MDQEQRGEKQIASVSSNMIQERPCAGGERGLVHPFLVGIFCWLHQYPKAKDRKKLYVFVLDPFLSEKWICERNE